MRRFGLGAASVLALWVIAAPAYASSFVASAEDGDESKVFFNKKSLMNLSTGATFDSSTPGNNTSDDVDFSTVGTVKNMGNGYATILGTDTGTDFLTSLTITPHSGTAFDGLFFRGQLGDESGTTLKTGVVNVSVTGVDNVVSNMSFNVSKLNKDFGVLGFEAANDTDLVQSVTISTNAGQFFEEFKQVDVSGVIGGSGVTTQGGGGGIPEPATWVVMLAGFGLAGTLLRRRVRAFAS